MFRIFAAEPADRERFGEITGMARIGPERSTPAPPARDLSVPWRAATPRGGIMTLVDWPCRLLPFTGRARELDALAAWAESDPPVSVMFLSGEHETGKSRLAAELCETLRGRGWSAGFADLTRRVTFPLRPAGTLVVVDDAAQMMDEARELLGDLAVLGLERRIRVLLAGAEDPSIWDDAIREAVIEERVQTPGPVLAPQTEADLRDFLAAAFAAAGKLFDLPAPLIDAEREKAILQSGIGPRGMLMAAFALIAAASPAEFAARSAAEAAPTAGTGSSARNARRTLEDLAFERAYFTATVAGSIPLPVLKEMLRRGLLGSETPQDLSIEPWLEPDDAGEELLLKSPGISPEAVAYTVSVLARNPAIAPELIWTGLRQNPQEALLNLGSLGKGCRVFLGLTDDPISRSLVAVVEGRVDRCRWIENLFSEIGISETFLPAVIATARTLIAHETGESRLARLWARLGEALEQVGDLEGSQEAARKGIDLLQGLAKNDPAWLDPELAASLVTLATSLEKVDRPAALRTMREAIEVLKRLADADPANWGERWATEMDSLSHWLEKEGDIEGAAAVLEETLPCRRLLAGLERDPFSGTWLRMSLEHLWEILYGRDQPFAALLRQKPDARRDRAFGHLQELIAVLRRTPPDEKGHVQHALAFRLVNLAEELRVRDRREEAIASLREGIALAETLPPSMREKLDDILKFWSTQLHDWETGKDLEEEAEIQAEIKMEQELREEWRRKGLISE